jgi:hypothetical protein
MQGGTLRFNNETISFGQSGLTTSGNFSVEGDILTCN